MPEPDARFVRVDHNTYRATDRTVGAWSPHEQHISPLAGLLAHEIEEAAGDDDKVTARYALDILGVVGVDDVEVTVATVRPGRTIALLEASAAWRGRTVARARAWRLSAYDSAPVAGGAPEAMPGPDAFGPWDMSSVWGGGYIASLEVRRDPATVPGRTRAWVRCGVPLLADEPVAAVAHWIGLVDTANGLSVRVAPEEWLFPNVDLDVHLHRMPRGEWVGFDTTVTFGGEGLGLTSSVLHDEHGPVGRAAQVLTVRRHPGATA